MVAKLLQMGLKMAPRWWQNCCQIGPGGLLGSSGVLLRSPGALKKAWSAKRGLPGTYGALLDASWGALGAKKSTLERLLAAPRGIPRQVSAILGAKRFPKGRPRGSKIESKRQLELKTRFLQNHSFQYNSSNFTGVDFLDVKIDTTWHRIAA